jgi:SAM-dependent methyltransferase
MEKSKRNFIKNCPLCKHSSYKQIVKKYSYLIVQCTKCRFVFVANPSINLHEDTIEHIEAVTAIIKSRHFEIKKMIDYYFLNQDEINIIEIGAGVGALAGLFKPDTRYHYIGFEPSKLRVDYAKSKGFTLINDYFHFSKINGQVDVIIIDNVLEHVPRPDTLVNEVSKALKKNGIVIVVVPNLMDIRKLIPVWKRRHYWQPHSHVNYFTYTHLKNIFGKYNIIIKSFPLIFSKNIFFYINVLLNKVKLFLLGLFCYGIKR